MRYLLAVGALALLALSLASASAPAQDDAGAQLVCDIDGACLPTPVPQPDPTPPPPPPPPPAPQPTPDPCAATAVEGDAGAAFVPCEGDSPTEPGQTPEPPPPPPTPSTPPVTPPPSTTPAPAPAPAPGPVEENPYLVEDGTLARGLACAVEDPPKPLIRNRIEPPNSYGWWEITGWIRNDCKGTPPRMGAFACMQVLKLVPEPLKDWRHRGTGPRQDVLAWTNLECSSSSRTGVSYMGTWESIKCEVSSPGTLYGYDNLGFELRVSGYAWVYNTDGKYYQSKTVSSAPERAQCWPEGLGPGGGFIAPWPYYGPPWFPQWPSAPWIPGPWATALEDWIF